MEKRCRLIFILLICLIQGTHAQIVTITPVTATGKDEVKLIYDATEGSGNLAGASKVYLHSGVVTGSPDGTEWQLVVGNWGQDDGVGLMSKVEGETDKWEITLSPTVMDYYNAPSGTNVFRLAMVFRNADGSQKGSGTPGSFNGGFVADNGDIYVDLAVDAFVSITAPTDPDIFVLSGESVNITASASDIATAFSLSIDEGSGFMEVATDVNTDNISFNYSPTSSGQLSIKANARIDGELTEVITQHNLFIRPESTVEAIPAGLRQGINYHADPSTATLVLLAPDKEFVYAVGDFNNWQIDNNYQMKRSPDGQLYWLELTGLTPGQEYIFQYWVDGTIKVGDPYSDKVADPFNDPDIPDKVYPDLIAYDKTENGIASVIQTGQTPFSWAASEDSWVRPEKDDLVIYELLVRDFLGSHDYKDLTDTLSYLKTLGVNAIELMPIMEFEGNESWGYNPSYFLAPDKYYGTKNDLKNFIQTAHQQGFAVILDMVLNHAFGQNAMVRMYWDEENNKPSSNSPWFNPDATHPFNVGFDFNHESAFTQQFVDSVNRYWLSEYHFDGFRFDLSKGFTQTNNPNDVGAWSAFDQSRINILGRMAGKIWEYDPNAYVILEHFADFNEELALVNQGMMAWRNKNFDYRQVVAGNTGNNFLGAEVNDWVSYMESHDEERLMYEAREHGRSEGAYDIRNPVIGLNRVKAAAAFFYLLPGPKMMWQFQELGYDIDIDFNGRTGNKPLVWGEGNLGYYEDPQRQKLYKTHAAIIKLRNDFVEVINDGNFTWNATGDVRKINITHNNLDLIVIGNFGLSVNTIDPSFSKTGTWYDYFSGNSLEVNDVNEPVSLAPGEFHIFTDRQVPTPEQGLIDVFKPVVITEPEVFSSLDEVKIIFDATAADPAGTMGLVGAQKVYMHAGVILDEPEGTEWSNIVGTLTDDGVGEMVKVEGEVDRWEITITPRNYFGVQAGQRIYRLAMYFRDASNENIGKGIGGSDIFLAVEPDGDPVIVTTDPAMFDASTNVKIIFDATAADPAGTAGLIGASKVYMHSGVVTDAPDGTTWQFVVGNWGEDDGLGEMSWVTGESNKWEIKITPRSYYNVPAATPVYRLGMVFRNDDGSREGKAEGGQDIFVEVMQPVTTGIEFKPFPNSIKIYPNPTRNRIQLQIDDPAVEHIRLAITNATGQVMHRGLIISRNKINWSLDTKPLSPGVYFIQIFAGPERYVEKVVIR